MSDLSIISFPNVSNKTCSVFEKPPHEIRFAYGERRSASGLGSAEVQKEVVEVTYLPDSKNAKVMNTVASADFIRSMEQSAYIVPVGDSKLVYASGFNCVKRPNVHAHQIACSHKRYRYADLTGTFYWVDCSPKTEVWWRTSIQYNLKKMPGLHSMSQSNLRIAVRRHIRKSPVDFGPYFIETVEHPDGGIGNPERYWFDIYAPTRGALNAIVLSL